MTRSLIYLIAIFALWLYFRFGNFETGYGKGSGTGGGGKTEAGNGFENTPQVGGENKTQFTYARLY